MRSVFWITVAGVLIAGCSETSNDPLSDPVLETAVEANLSQVIRAGAVSVADAAFSCPYRQTQSIFFSSATTPDTLTFDVIGEDCDTARLQTTVTTLEGDVVFFKNETVSTYIYDDEGPESVRRLLGTVASGQIFNAGQVKSGRELIPLDDVLERSGFYDIDESAYQRAIDDDLPLFCHQEVATYTTCFVYLDGLTVQILGTGS